VPDETILRPYVTNLDRPVFALRNLPEEVVAVLFAYYSRSREGLRDNLLRLLEGGEVAVEGAACEDDDEATLLAAREKAKAFHEKWVVGYGHSSVAEHAVVHLAIEEVSILASKVIEDARLASFTEKSTRYVVFDETKYYTPPALSEGPMADVYAGACRHLLGTYARLMDETVERVRERRPRGEKQTERGWNTACKAAACDVLRYILPASTRTNIGMTANARTLEHLLAKLASHPLEECRELSATLKEEARRVAPTLIKYADRNAYLAETPSALSAIAREEIPATGGEPDGPQVRLLSGPAEADIELVTALLYEHSLAPWCKVRERAAAMSPERRAGIVREAAASVEDGGRRGKFDQPIRALEHLYYTFEVLVDFGAFRDIQRHRMATQTRQRLSTAWGYSTPPEIAEFGLDAAFTECMERSAEAYETLAASHPEEAQYVLPLAWRMRVLFTWNLRELHHFISLRSGKQGHASYRRVAQDVWRALAARDPLMAEHIRVDMKDYGLARE